MAEEELVLGVWTKDECMLALMHGAIYGAVMFVAVMVIDFFTAKMELKA